MGGILVMLILTGVAAKIIWPLMVVVMAAVIHLLDTPPELLIN